MKHGVAFVIGRIGNGFRSIVAILALYPLLFIPQSQYATLEELHVPELNESTDDANASTSDGDYASDIGYAITKFLGDHALIIIGVITLACVAVVIYIFRLKGPSSTESPCSTDIASALAESTTRSSIVSSFIKSIVFSSLVKYILTIYASWILFLRSFFLKERAWFIPIVMLIAHFDLYFHIQPIHEYSDITRLFLWLGIYLMGVDSIGSLISSYALSNTPNLFDEVIPFLTEKRSRIFEYYCHPGLVAILVGKTPMTATGRAVLGVGLMSGAALFINAHLERQHQGEQNRQNHDREDQRAQANRDFQAAENQRNRDIQDQKDRQNAYKLSWNPFKKPLK